MNEPKAFASLSSGLLARKGAAKPAMRPQGFGQMGASLEDLGWNDMGFEAPKPTAAPHERDADHDAFGESVAEQPVRNPVAALTPSPVHGQQAEIAERFAAQEEDDEIGETEAIEQEDEEVVETEAAEPEVVAQAPAPATVLPDPIDLPAEPEVAIAPVLSIKPQAPAVVAAPVRSPTVRAERGSGPKAAFTLRLDSARHLKLRLACALTGRSAQMLVTDAVDKMLADYPELEKFAGQLPQRSQSRRVKG